MRFMGYRMSLLWSSWRRYADEWEDNEKTWLHCQGLTHPTAACAAATEALKTHPFVNAWKDVADVTHLCGDKPCGDWALWSLAGVFVVLAAGLQVLRQARLIVDEGVAPLIWRNPRRRACPDGWCAIETTPRLE